ncbi:MAG: glycosyltransferase family 2 protein [Burkholderiaceae bacterium]
MIVMPQAPVALAARNVVGPANPPHHLSVVVPLYNEAESVGPLVDSIAQALSDYPHPWELVLVDDGSTDDTTLRASAAAARCGPHVRVVELMRNFKQTAAMQAGVDAARGDVIVTLDGDLQNDPKDIPRLVERLLLEDLDCVAGWRRDRQDGFWLRKVPSLIANRLIGRFTGVRLRDYGCSLKAFRTSVLRNVRLYGEMHRFIPAWLAMVTSPRRIAEEPVRHHPRLLGVSKYGLSRTLGVLLDLLSVVFFMRFRARPGHFFGGLGVAVCITSIFPLLYLAWLKFAQGADIGTRPLLFVGLFGLLAGFQMILTGVLAEMLSRVYFEAGAVRSYVVRPTPAIELAAGWHAPVRSESR